jgi:hypothetical protein
MNTLLGILAFLTVNAPIQNVGHEEHERFYKPEYLSIATGELAARSTRELHPWPVNVLSIGHTNASYQVYGLLSSAYFHHGLDIRANAGSAVLASTGGKVVNIENYVLGNPAYWEIAILDDEGFLWQYHHVDRSSIPECVFVAFKNGSRIEQGTKIGEVFYWEIETFGERYHHIHLNVLGKGKNYLSPFAFLEKLPDTQGPTFGEIALTQGNKKISGSTVSGSYSVMAELKDLILHERFIVPPHEIIIRIDNGLPQTVWKFDSLPGGSSEEKYVHELYIPGVTCGNYSCRKPIVNLGFSKEGKAVFPQSSGNHEVEVEIRDYNGNGATKKFSWSVQ